MYVVFIHGPAASGKHTIGARLSEQTGMPLFHNHLAVDAAKALFDFGTAPFRMMRATIWLTAFAEAAAAGRSFIFTFHPEASVEPDLINEMIHFVEMSGGRVFFVALTCSRKTILDRLANASRSNFGKLTDPELYRRIEEKGGFAFPALPPALVTIDTDKTTPNDAARHIADAIRARQQ
jgi:deoxyadenosine/deoxycytidine kinase